MGRINQGPDSNARNLERWNCSDLPKHWKVVMVLHGVYKEQNLNWGLSKFLNMWRRLRNEQAFQRNTAQIGAWQQVCRMPLPVVGYFLIIQTSVGFSWPQK
jgi:hypothetical protein